MAGGNREQGRSDEADTGQVWKSRTGTQEEKQNQKSNLFIKKTINKTATEYNSIQPSPIQSSLLLTGTKGSVSLVERRRMAGRRGKKGQVKVDQTAGE